MSRKEVIKCDKCDKEIGKEDAGFYNITHENVPGWAQFYHPYPGGRIVESQVCENCFDSFITKKR